MQRFFEYGCHYTRSSEGLQGRLLSPFPGKGRAEIYRWAERLLCHGEYRARKRRAKRVNPRLRRAGGGYEGCPNLSKVQACYTRGVIT